MDQYLRKQDDVHLSGIQMVQLFGIQMASKYQTIWHPTSFQPFKCQTSWVFRFPLYLKIILYFVHYSTSDQIKYWSIFCIDRYLIIETENHFLLLRKGSNQELKRELNTNRLTIKSFTLFLGLKQMQIKYQPKLSLSTESKTLGTHWTC